jgi:hypothetical protein
MAIGSTASTRGGDRARQPRGRAADREDSVRIELGTVDELNAVLGVVRVANRGRAPREADRESWTILSTDRERLFQPGLGPRDPSGRPASEAAIPGAPRGMIRKRSTS